MTKKLWILGKMYDLSKAEERGLVMDLIDDAKARDATNDLSLIAYALMVTLDM